MKNYLARNHKDVAHCTKCNEKVTIFFKILSSNRKTKMDVQVEDNDKIQVVRARRGKILASHNTINVM